MIGPIARRLRSIRPTTLAADRAIR